MKWHTQSPRVAVNTFSSSSSCSPSSWARTKFSSTSCTAYPLPAIRAFPKPDTKLQLHFVAARHVGITLNNSEAAAQMSDGFEVGAGLGGLLAGLEPETHCGFALTGTLVK